MRELIKCKTAIDSIINGYEVKLITTDFKTNIFTKNPNTDGKPIMWTIRKSSGPDIIRYLTYDEFKEKYKNESFYRE